MTKSRDTCPGFFFGGRSLFKEEVRVSDRKNLTGTLTKWLFLLGGSSYFFVSSRRWENLPINWKMREWSNVG